MKTTKVHSILVFVAQYTFSTPYRKKNPDNQVDYQGLFVPRPGVEPGWK